MTRSRFASPLPVWCMATSTGFFAAAQKRPDVQLVGIFDPDKALQHQYAQQYKFADSLFFTDLGVMLDQTKPEAVAAFSSTLDHPIIVEAAAKRHIDVMMEKPLAVSVAQADAIQSAARQGGIQVIVNYETTWYKSHGAIWQLAKQQHALGDIRTASSPWTGTRGRRRSTSVRSSCLADGSGEEWGGRFIRFRLLRRQPDDVADGQSTSHRRDRIAPNRQAADLSACR